MTAQVAAKVGAGGGITNSRSTTTRRTRRRRARGHLRQPGSPEVTIARARRNGIQAGDKATLYFAAPLDKTAPGFQAIMSLGSGSRIQGVGRAHLRAGGQFSIVDVNATPDELRRQLRRRRGQRRRPDHGRRRRRLAPTTRRPQQLTTGVDDELYNLAPFLAQRRHRARDQHLQPVARRQPVPRRDLDHREAAVTTEDLRRRHRQRRRRAHRRRRPGLHSAPDGEHVRQHPGQRRPARERTGSVRVRDPLQDGRSFAHRQPVVQRQGDPMVFDSTSISTLVINGDDATATGSGIANGLPVTFRSDDPQPSGQLLDPTLQRLLGDLDAEVGEDRDSRQVLGSA